MDRAWQAEAYFGKHHQLIPAEGAQGYSYTNPNMVHREIPVEGTVTETAPSWHRSPQAAYWLRPDPEPIRRLITRKLRNGAHAIGAWLNK